jgi:hypothetical protein
VGFLGSRYFDVLKGFSPRDLVIFLESLTFNQNLICTISKSDDHG